MFTAHKVEIQPTPTQRQMLRQHAGVRRWVYNWALAKKKEAWARRKSALESGSQRADAPKVPTGFDLSRELTLLKRLPVEQGGVPWMRLSSSRVPVATLVAVETAFMGFFRRAKKGENPGHPKFKSKSRTASKFCVHRARVTSKTIRLPKIGHIRIKPGAHGYIPIGITGQVSVSERAGRWFVSVLAPEREDVQPRGDRAVGIDLGVVQLATLSTGAIIENPKVLKAAERTLKRRQRSVSRKKMGSANQRKAAQSLAKAHARIANQRKDVLHKATTNLVKNHDRIVIEDLKLGNMTKRRSGKGRAAKAGLNRVILDAGMGTFRRMLEYKGKLYGCEIVAVPPHKTSQRCSGCGYMNPGNRTTQRRFMCLSCGHKENADLNAAKNILVAGSCPETKNACGDDVRPRVSGLLSVKQESAGTGVPVSSNGNSSMYAALESLSH